MSWNDFKNEYKVSLNKKQEQAVKVDGKDCLLLAVPGSGKTTTMVTKVGYHINELKVKPKSIIAVTFTKASARDMEARYQKMFGTVPEGLGFSTLHSFCYKILSVAEKKGIEKMPRLEPSRNFLLTNIYREIYHDYPTEGEVQEMDLLVSYSKNMLLSPKGIKSLVFNGDSFEDIFKEYQKRMKSAKKMDYDDLLGRTMKLLKKDDVRKILLKGYKYIFVDEAQDISKLQHAIIDLIRKECKSLFMVGDEDQSIYGFRAAFPQALLSFGERYKNSEVMTLDINYRSKKEIVDMANVFIKSNVERYDKEMKANRKKGGVVNFPIMLGRDMQYTAIALKLKDTKKQTAVLYRNNDNVLPLIVKLDEMGIPFSCRDYRPTFFSSRFVKNVLNMCDYLADQTNGDKFLDVYYLFGLPILKEHAFQAAEKRNKKKDKNHLETYRRIRRDSPVETRRIEKVVEKIEKIDINNASLALTGIFKEFCIIEKQNTEKARILKAIAKDDSLSHFVSKMRAIEKKISENAYEANSNIILSTVHGSKGMEFPGVILMDAVNGVFPSLREDSSLEEERRLFYVAITRAKDELEILRYEDSNSMFLEELGVYENEKEVTSSWDPTISSIHISNNINKEGGYKLYEAHKATSSKTKVNVKKGMRVIHKKEGSGTVAEVKDDHITITFKNGKQKKYSLSKCLDLGVLEIREV